MAEDTEAGGVVPVEGSEPTEGTRERILDAATALLVEGGVDNLAMERVAGRAGVARGTIYYQFGSRAGLLEGLIGAIERQERIHLSREEDRTVVALLERVTGIWERHRDVLRGVFAMAAVDPQAGEVVRRHQLGRRQRIIELIADIEEAGALRAEPDDAVDLVWLLTAFSTYDFVRGEGHRDPGEARRLLELLAAPLTASGDHAF